MPAPTEYSGLCSTCKHASECSFPGCPREPVFCCEEFDSGEPPPMKTTSRHNPQHNYSGSNEDQDAARFSGLCSNCENRYDCALGKPEGGVWHCEEYQ